MPEPDPLAEVRQHLIDAVTDPDSASYRGDMAHDLLAVLARVSSRHPIGHDCRLCRQVRRTDSHEDEP